jgi:Holliday junction resolvase RusA-like endonuclease
LAITFSVPGEPVPQPRPRVSTRGGFARAYVPKTHAVHAYRQSLAAAARDAGVTQTGEPLSVVIDAVFVRPKSHLRKSGVKPDAPKLPRPDVDNIAKACLDALQDVIGDDTCVARLVIEKSYGTEARTTVRIG